VVGGALNSRLGLFVIALITGVTWSLTHAYRGIFHDSALYTLQALAHLQPELAQDVFLRFGSQDRFSFFSPLYAAAITCLGTENAAAFLTLLSQLGLLAAAWYAARGALDRTFAALGAGAFACVPGFYGSGRIFSCIEPFLTPRMLAEALILAGIGCMLRSKWRTAAVLTITAAAMHPVMALAGVVAMACPYLARHPRSASLLAAAAVVIVLAAAVAPPGPWGRFDAAWLALVEARSPYLFLEHWTDEDAGRVLVALTTLLLAALYLDRPRSRLLAGMALATGTLGICLTAVACDWLRLQLPTQAQPWRWMWLATVCAALLAPRTVFVLWGRQRCGRTTAALLLAAWLFAAGSLATVACLLAATSIFAARLRPAYLRWLQAGAGAALLLAILWRVASNLEFSDMFYLDAHLAPWLRRVQSFAGDGSAAIALLALVAWLGAGTRRRIACAAAGLAAVLAALLIVPPSSWSWTVREFDTEPARLIAAWRAIIPSEAEVFWPEAPPADTWILLNRRSYVSSMQSSGVVFSRAAAMELNRRAATLASVITPHWFMGWESGNVSLLLSREQLQSLCGLEQFDFLVTRAVIDAPVAARATAPGKAPPLLLYRCRDQTRAAAAAAT
jgi:hypothetical protein